jgi:TolA-binding protein|tara:strand:- start:249 stop:650 length:402 start_codon:yes stop_codon:yes gene_type:complete
MSYTLGEAAIACGKSKSTISKAIKAGKISAEKNDHGTFEIEASELHRVYPPAPSPIEQNTIETVEYEQNETLKNTSNIEVLQAKLDMANERIEELKQDKDKLEIDKEQWRQQATNLLAAPDRRGLLQRIFSKG